MNKRICLITPGHIASNPRLVKEARALQQSGMEVHIIFSHLRTKGVPEHVEVDGDTGIPLYPPEYIIDTIVG